jgi:hypothetical protein
VLIKNVLLASVCSALWLSCGAPMTENDEIVDNLQQAGFPADEIMTVDGKVYVGRDAEVSLAASREMLDTNESGKEQYRTTNTVRTSSLPTGMTKICLNGSTLTGVFSTALDMSIQKYNERKLTFVMARTPSTDCSFTVSVAIQPGQTTASSGFPFAGAPFGTIGLGAGLATSGVQIICVLYHAQSRSRDRVAPLGLLCS